MNLHNVIIQDSEAFRVWMEQSRFVGYEWQIITHDPLAMRYRRNAAAMWHPLTTNDVMLYLRQYRDLRETQTGRR